MPVTNIECQIARGQISRYVAGDRFSQEAVNQLEGHIAECPHCKRFLSERRAALQSMLGGAPSPKAVIEVAVPDEPASPAARLQEALKQVSLETPAEPKARPAMPKKEKAEAPAKPKREAKTAPSAPKSERSVSSASFTKPAIYALALAVVVIGMNAFTKASGSILGPKAASAGLFNSIAPATTPTSANPTPESATVTPSKPTDAAGTTETTSPAPTVPAPTVATVNASEASAATDATDSATLEEPVEANTPPSSGESTSLVSPEPTKVETPTAVTKPKPVVKATPRVTVRSTPVRSTRRRSSSRRSRTPRVTRRSTPRASGGNTIKVYDAQGNPIQ